MVLWGRGGFLQPGFGSKLYRIIPGGPQRRVFPHISLQVGIGSVHFSLFTSGREDNNVFPQGHVVTRTGVIWQGSHDPG